MHKPTNSWLARIRTDANHRKTIGYFKTPELAAKAYNEAALRYHGEFARLNPLPSVPVIPAV